MRGRLGRALRKWHREDDACFCRVRLRLNAQTSAFLAQTRIEFGPQRCDLQAWAESPGSLVGLPQLVAGCWRRARRAEKDGFDRAQKARGAPPRTLERPGPPQEERLAFGAMRSWFRCVRFELARIETLLCDAFRWGSYSRRWPKLRRLPGVRRRIPGQLARRFLALCKKSAATCRLSCVESAPPRQSSLVAICEARRRESAPSCRFSHREPKKGIGPCRHVEKRSDASH